MDQTKLVIVSMLILYFYKNVYNGWLIAHKERFEFTDQCSFLTVIVNFKSYGALSKFEWCFTVNA